MYVLSSVLVIKPSIISELHFSRFFIQYWYLFNVKLHLINFLFWKGWFIPFNSFKLIDPNWILTSHIQICNTLYGNISNHVITSQRHPVFWLSKSVDFHFPVFHPLLHLFIWFFRQRNVTCLSFSLTIFCNCLERHFLLIYLCVFLVLLSTILLLVDQFHQKQLLIWKTPSGRSI